MSERSVRHDTFTLERRYEADPARVFAAWASPEAKAQWFGATADEHSLDFRVGGREVSRGTLPDGRQMLYDARYEDIVPEERIVFTYVMDLGDVRISASVASIELRSDGGGTRLVYTEQGAFLDGHDDPREREHGTGLLLDAVARHLGETEVHG